MDTQKIVENIQRICKERGTNPTVAGEKSGAGKSLVTQLKTRGIMPSIEKFQMLAEYLGVTTSELLGEEKPTPEGGSGLSEEQLEVIRRYDAAPPALRAAALAVLKSAEEQDKVQNGGTTRK